MTLVSLVAHSRGETCELDKLARKPSDAGEKKGGRETT